MKSILKGKQKILKDLVVSNKALLNQYKALLKR